MTSIGQKTGTLNTSKKVHINAMSVDLIAEYLKNYPTFLELKQSFWETSVI